MTMLDVNNSLCYIIATICTKVDLHLKVMFQKTHMFHSDNSKYKIIDHKECCSMFEEHS